jgi:large subunit ribosomal protein L1
VDILLALLATILTFPSQAIELENPSATVNLTLDLRSKNEKDNARNSSLRGRVSLAADPRKTVDVVLVFAEPGSESEKLAKAEKVAYVGASDLFEQLLEGEIQPTKILSTPGLLPSVTQNLARFLGPKGLMPTVRRGGVGEGQELVERIREAKGAFDWMVNDEGLIKAGK